MEKRSRSKKNVEWLKAPTPEQMVGKPLRPKVTVSEPEIEERARDARIRKAAEDAHDAAIDITIENVDARRRIIDAVRKILREVTE